MAQMVGRVSAFKPWYCHKKQTNKQKNPKLLLLEIRPHYVVWASLELLVSCNLLASASLEAGATGVCLPPCSNFKNNDSIVINKTIT
jgi:hypothetical protein